MTRTASRVDRLEVAGLTISGVARGGVETCLMVRELKVMFDVGMCPPGATSYDHVLVSHGHCDHLGGFAYLAGQRGLIGKPPVTLHVPREIVAPMTRILDAWAEIEGYRAEVELCGHDPGDRVTLGRDRRAVCLRSSHRVPSLCWIVERVRRRLRPELTGRPGHELAALRRAGVEIDCEHATPELCVTGDTRIECFAGAGPSPEPGHELVRRSRVLVHEVTDWDTERTPERARRWGHTHVSELAAVAEQFTGEALVLVHRSERHSRAEVEGVVGRVFPESVRGRVHVFGR